MDLAWSGYSSAQRPVMKIVEGTLRVRSVEISSGLSKRSPPAARGPWSEVMSASKVRATVLSACCFARSKTGVRPFGPGARVGALPGAPAGGAPGRGLWEAAAAPGAEAAGDAGADAGGVPIRASRPASGEPEPPPQPARDVVRAAPSAAAAATLRTEMVTHAKYMTM